jgi:hypothetical protein
MVLVFLAISGFELSFVDGFIKEFPEYYAKLVSEDGTTTALIILRNRFRARDPNRKYYALLALPGPVLRS